MQCEEFEDRLNAVLDERRRPEWDDELRLHCDNCADCRQLAAEYDTLLDGFYSWTTPEAPADLALRVLIEARPQPAPRRRMLVPAAALATAAVVLIAVSPLVWRASQQPNQANALADANIKNQRQRQAFRQLPLVPGLMSIADAPGGDPYAGLAKETGQGLATVVLYVPGVGGTKGIIDVDADGGQGQPAWAVQMSEGLRPLTNSVTETFNLLLLPVSQLAARS
jgi:hypothetical protein